ncbi:MAG: hypothetical protein Q8P81_03315 [Nanoarchaeota archaeon]|nr:hypothetical protein [Nanoarchaeota archaeon]
MTFVYDCYLDGDKRVISYAFSKCSPKEGQYVKRVGRMIAEGRLRKYSPGSNFCGTFSMLNEDRTLLRNMLKHCLTFKQEINKDFKELLGDWINASTLFLEEEC